MWPTNVMSYFLGIRLIPQLSVRFFAADGHGLARSEKAENTGLRRFPGRFASFPPHLIRVHSYASGGSLLSSAALTLEQLGEERNQLRRLDGLGFLRPLQVLDVVHDQMRPDSSWPGIGGDDVVRAGGRLPPLRFQFGAE